MATKKIEIVGAGFAGLVAGINLAREGFEVTIYERQKQHGGRPSVRPDPAGSPFNLDMLAEFIGIDISPACQLNKEFHFCIWGKKKTLTYNEGCKTYMVERGARESSLDSLLLREAEKAGVNILFNHSLERREQFENLPANAIITVGLEEDGYRVLDQPSVPLYGYYARGKSNKMEPEVCLYFDSYTKDYGFTSNINGCCFAFLIGRVGQVPPDGPQRFREQVEQTCSYDLHGWQTFDTSVLPHASSSAPRLFWNNKILAGTVAGMMDPVLYFGMLGALISGKIAANAVTNPELARQQFEIATLKYKQAWVTKKLLNQSPDVIRRAVFSMLPPFLSRVPANMLRKFWMMVPGYNVYG